jgi:hypothetical protein
MKQQQKFITTLSLIVGLSGLSPVMAADRGTSGGEAIQPDMRRSDNHLRHKLSTAQMDQIHAGLVNDGGVRCGQTHICGLPVPVMEYLCHTLGYRCGFY